MSCNVLCNLDSFDLATICLGHFSNTSCHKGVALVGVEPGLVPPVLVSGSCMEQRSTKGNICRSLWMSDHVLALPCLFPLLSECLEGAELGLNRRPFCNFNQGLESVCLRSGPALFSPRELVMEQGMEGWMNGCWWVGALRSHC